MTLDETITSFLYLYYTCFDQCQFFFAILGFDESKKVILGFDNSQMAAGLSPGYLIGTNFRES